MKFKQTHIKGLVLVQPQVWEDKRGSFWESYRQELFQSNNIPTGFVQDNESISNKTVLRGLHLQLPPYAQAKFINVPAGSILDVAVDLRKNSPTYGNHYSVVLSEKNKNLLYIPEGFAHGFLSLEEGSRLQYKCSQIYNKPSELGLMWNDADLNINWGIQNPIVSDKDKNNINLKDFDSPF